MSEETGPQQCWFMSYAQRARYTGELRLRSCTYRGPEHPIAKVARWNKVLQGTCALISWRELLPEEFEALPEIDHVV